MAVLFLGGLVHFFSWPIGGTGDTDLWYHLNSGRYFFTHNQIADNGFFSFHGHDRYWANYYWLYQLVVYQLFSFGGYPGLIVFRSVVYLATTLIIAFMLCRGRKTDSEAFYFSVLVALFFCVLIPRYFSMVRPHMASYLLIPVCILLMEARNRWWLLLLPVLAVLWANLHGIEYPVLLILCGAYLAETGYKRFREGGAFAIVCSRVGLIMAAMVAILLNPFGLALLKTPFVMSPDIERYIIELAPTAISDLIRFDFSSVDTIFPTLSNIILLLALLSFVRGCWTKKIRLSHLLIFMGGMYLLSRGTRFRYEAVLMALPVLAAHPLVPSFTFGTKLLQRLGGLGAVGIMGLALLFLHNVFLFPGHYPFSSSRLPAGVTAFLRQVDTGGKVLNVPSHGGFLQWELGDRYSLFMDMQMILFRDTDYFMAVSALTEKEGLAKLVDQYHPAYLAPNISNKKFPVAIKAFPQYQPVFFDDVDVLYVDNGQFPDIAARFGLKHVDPFAIGELRLDSCSGDERAAVLAELTVMNKIYPAGRIVNHLLILAQRYQGNQEQAFVYARKMIVDHPQLPTGYRLAGEELLLVDRYQDAKILLQEALRRASETSKPALCRALWLCAKGLNDPSLAYTSFRSAVDPFASDTDWHDLLTLTKAAIESEHFKEAKEFLDLLVPMIPSTEKEAFAELSTLQMAVSKVD